MIGVGFFKGLLFIINLADPLL